MLFLASALIVLLILFTLLGVIICVSIGNTTCRDRRFETINKTSEKIKNKDSKNDNDDNDFVIDKITDVKLYDMQSGEVIMTFGQVKDFKLK